MKRHWLLALLPFAPIVAALLVHAPLDDVRVVSLAGTWGVARGGGAAVASETRVADAEVEVRFPGRFPRGIPNPLLVRTFVLEEGQLGEHYSVVFGGVSNAQAELWVNGVWIGGEGVPSLGYKLEQISLNLYAVDRRHLRVGENTIVVAVTADDGVDQLDLASAAIVDRELMIGPASVVRPWFDRNLLLARLLELGGMTVLAFAAALIFVLSLFERDPVARQLQRALVAMSLCIVAYLAGRSGLITTLGFDRGLPLSITAIGWAMPELLERAVLGRITRFQQLNRVICACHIAAQFVVTHYFLYIAFIPYLLVLLAYSAFIAVRGAWRLPSTGMVLLSASVMAMVAAGVNDLLTDLNVLANPRLFSLAAVDMGLVGAIFVVGRFLRTMGENADLLVSVESTNRELLRALDRAEESTRMKSAFLANTSHELRTPLNSIVNIPEGLLEEFVQRPFVVCARCASLFEAPEGYRPDESCPHCDAEGTFSTELRAVFAGDPDEAMRYLRVIQQAGRHLLAVVTDILDFSKIEAGRMAIHLDAVVLDDLLEKLNVVMLPQTESRSITLVVERTTDHAGQLQPTTTLAADEVKLTQVLMNLVSNAIKFSPVGSEVRVSARVGADDVTLSVIDHGVGISEADCSRIFESFVQVDNSHTRSVGGTGLGLAISKNLVGLMHGTLHVESVLGQGSTFVVTFAGRSGRLNALTSSSGVAST